MSGHSRKHFRSGVYGANIQPVRPEFTAAELMEMDEYCRIYRDLVRGGGIPSEEESEYFMAYQGACYVLGIAHE